MSRNDGYTKGNLVDQLYDQTYYKLIGIDLSGRRNTTIPQNINSTGKLEEDNCAINAPLPKSITQINVTSMNDAEELDLVMSMYNFVD